jgi:hypothetical protein
MRPSVPQPLHGAKYLTIWQRVLPKASGPREASEEVIVFFGVVLIYFHLFPVVLVTHRPVLLHCGENCRKYEYQETDH